MSRYLFTRSDVLNLQLNLAALMCVLLDSIDNVERTLGLDVTGFAALSERNAVHDMVGVAVNELKFDVLLIATDYFAGAVVIDLVCAEDGFAVVWSIGTHPLEVVLELVVDVVERDDGISRRKSVNIRSILSTRFICYLPVHSMRCSRLWRNRPHMLSSS